MHKFDSTLRGNWAEEISAVAARGRRVVMIPSHPLAGRICAGGVVYVALALHATFRDNPLARLILVPRHTERLAGPLDELFGYVREGALRPHIGRVYPLSEVRQAHAELEERRSVGKLLLSP